MVIILQTDHIWISTHHSDLPCHISTTIVAFVKNSCATSQLKTVRRDLLRDTGQSVILFYIFYISSQPIWILVTCYRFQPLFLQGWMKNDTKEDPGKNGTLMHCIIRLDLTSYHFFSFSVFMILHHHPGLFFVSAVRNMTQRGCPVWSRLISS